MTGNDQEFEGQKNSEAEEFATEEFATEEFPAEDFTEEVVSEAEGAEGVAPVAPVAEPVVEAAAEPAVEEFATEEFATEEFATEEFATEEFEAEDFEGDEYGETYDEAAYDTEEFADDDFGDDEFSDEEWGEDDDYAEDDGGQTAGAADKKKKLTNVVVLGVAGIIGLGVMYMQMSGGSTQKPPVATQVAQPKAQPAPQQQAQNTQLPTDSKTPPADPQTQPADPKPAIDVADKGGMGGGLLHNPGGFDNLTDDGSKTEKPDDGGYFPDGVDVATNDGLPQPPPIENKTTDSPVVDTPFELDKPALSDQVLPDVAPIQTTDTAAPVIDNAALEDIKSAMQAQTEQLGSSLSATQEALAGVTDKLDKFAARMDAMEGEIKVVKSMKSKAAPAGNQAGGSQGTSAGSGVSSEELAKLEEAIIYLDKQLQSSLQAQSEQIKSFQTAQDKKLASLKSDIKKDMEGLKAAPVVPKTIKSSSTSSTVKSTSKPVIKTVTKTAKPAVSKVRWVLKAAMPGQAYVARKGSGDILQVTVGDKLPGIGRITKISMTNNRWVVKGTSGSIHQ